MTHVDVPIALPSRYMQILPEFDDEDQRFVTSFLDVMAVVPSRGIAVCASNQYVLKTQPNPWTNCFQGQS